eukprot:CAMPEP_0197939260 /NCGR_PEP_ID=MMETSP1439-20131203/119420_1 /TAXON_ID=66791 /ORGANISM="Gonyaulax spinifera, Strain CCMP409" /LENGTH=30 /DNA_ID= /DNA_START= /DNA_END= /DNA_ORIENTATION=
MEQVITPTLTLSLRLKGLLGCDDEDKHSDD